MLRTLKEVGATCKAYRESLGKLQREVARDTGYSPENISSFETGRNDNMYILFWYIENGIDVDTLKE